MEYPDTLQIRECTMEDLQTLCTVSRDTFAIAFETQNNPTDFNTYLDKAFSSSTLEKELRNPETTFYFVYSGTRMVAYFKVNTGAAQTDLNEPHGMELERIYVLPGFQGKGIGKQLLDHVKDMARKADKAYLWLGVWEENKKAIRFYEKQGLRKIGMHPYYVGEDRQMDWLMKIELRTLKT